MPDLSSMLKEIIEVMEKHGMEKPAVAIAFTTKNFDEYKEVHWATNVTRENGYVLLMDTAEKMIAQTN